MTHLLRSLVFISLIIFIYPLQPAAAGAALDDQWLYNASGYNRAVELQRELKVPLIVYFYTDWCPYCHELDASYLPTPVVQDYLRGVVKVRINPESGPAEREIADRFNVTGYPRFYVIRNPSAIPKNLQPFRRGGNNLTPEQFIMACQQVAPVSVRKSTPSQMVVNPEGRNATTAPRLTKPRGSAAGPEIVTDAKLPSLDAVLQKYIDAIGGKDAQAKITSRVIKGKVDLVGVSRGGKLEGYMMAPNKSLMVLEVHPIGVTKEGFDGRAGWVFSQKAGMRNLKGPELTALASDADFYHDLRIKELYPTTKLLGKTKSGFRELYVVQAIPRDGAAEYFYFDVESGLLFRRDATRQTPEGIVRAEIYYGDWREVDGIRLPFSITHSMGQMTLALTIEEVKHNVPLEDAMFRCP